MRHYAYFQFWLIACRFVVKISVALKQPQINVTMQVAETPQSSMIVSGHVNNKPVIIMIDLLR